MVTALIWILLAVVAIPIVAVVAWKAFTFILALICDIGNLIWAFLFFAIVLILVGGC